ncbi:MAG: prepilin-type N-terminal cleavage/methylation domain-containing protein [Phycisphaerales bacterium]
MRRRTARAFTLLEALIASAVLSLIVLAVGAAVTAGQQASFDARNAVLAAMAGDDLLADLAAVDYAALSDYDEFSQPLGAIATLGGRAYPVSYGALGRSVLVEEVILEEPETSARIRGKRIVVNVFDAQRVVVTVETFRPEPAP